VVIHTKNNVFKNTTDAAAVLGIVCSAFFLLVAYSSFEPTDKIPKFFDDSQNAVYIGILGAFALSLLANIFSRSVPFFGLAAALVPLWYLLNCMKAAMLTGENPMLYVLLALVHLAGALIYTLQWLMHEDLNRRKAVLCSVSALLTVLLYFAVYALVFWDAKYGEPLSYLRVGLAASAILSSLCAVFFYRPLAGKKERAAGICVTVGFALSLAALIFEFI